MKQFLKTVIHFSLIGVIPLIILFFGYIIYDPFKVVYQYNDYSYAFVIPNRDYISTEMFIKNNKKYNYNSFIFGSSRTLGFRPGSWSKYLSFDDRPFMFDASGESIYGIYTKIKFLDSINVKIDNSLIILCRDASFEHSENHKGHLNIKHPITSGESKMKFQIGFFKSYLNPKFLYFFYNYLFTKNYKSYMYGYIENRKITYDTITNEINIIDQEDEITKDPIKYYTKRKKLFYERRGEKEDSVQRINSKHLFMLKEIKQILEKNKTNYKIVISPLYDQIKFNHRDLTILNDLFETHLYDFSGKNSITDSINNYYELSHFRPIVGDSILKIIYK